MNLTKYVLDGKEYHLLLNGEALFDCYEHFGYEKDFLDLIGSDGKDGFAAAAWMLSTFSMQGEMYRRWQGEDRGSYLREAQARAILTPADLPGLKLALMETIKAGFIRKHEGNASVDPWLQELSQKKTKESLVRSIFALPRKFSASAQKKE